MGFTSLAQSLISFRSDTHSYGYTAHGKVVIAPQYDTAFAFDKSNSIAMTGNKNKRLVTGASTPSMDYYFINARNHKLVLKTGQLNDSTCIFPHQQELTGNYLNKTNQFRVLFNNKVYLFNKRGAQLSTGFENINETAHKRFYVIETDIKRFQEVKRAKGLIDSTGKTIVKCENKHIHINAEDSVIYCCTAVFGLKLSDNVFDYSGNVIYSSRDHIEFSTGTLHVTKRYEPKEAYIIENSIKKSSNEIEGHSFYYLKHHKALIIHKNDWYLVDLDTLKKQKVDKEVYSQNIYSIFVF